MAPEVHVTDVVAATIVGLVYIAACSFVPEPARRRFNAVMIAGAGSAYLSGGLGWWEFAFAGVLTTLAYRGLDTYRAIGIAWILHVGWDVVHHFHGDPIVWCVPTSSAQCAVCDTILAVWFLWGAPSVFHRASRG